MKLQLTMRDLLTIQTWACILLAWMVQYVGITADWLLRIYCWLTIDNLSCWGGPQW